MIRAHSRLRLAKCWVAFWFTACLAIGGCMSIDQVSDVSASSCAVGLYDSTTTDGFLIVTRSGTSYRVTDHSGRLRDFADGDRGAECENGKLRIADNSEWQLRSVTQQRTTFVVDATTFVGQLILPFDAGPTTPLVAVVHGSEPTGWVDISSIPYQLVGRGVGVFVYDKRGTGQSEGSYSQNFPQLAADLVAASAHAKTVAAGRFGRFGIVGFSQGGWVAPLAAATIDTDFLAVGYGLLTDLREEDADQVALQLREAGFDDAVIARAKQVTDATARMVASDYQDGIDDLEQLTERHAGSDWLQSISTGYTGIILQIPIDQIRQQGIPQFAGLNIDWSLDPVDIVRSVSAPQLWVLAAEDREAPIKRTQARLNKLMREGKHIHVCVFPDTDHGMREFTQTESGERTYTGVTDGYYAVLVDWAHGLALGAYGRADCYTPSEVSDG